MKTEVGAVDGADRVVLCGGTGLRGFAVVCLEEGLCMFVDACVIELESAQSEDFIEDVVEKVDCENA